MPKGTPIQLQIWPKHHDPVLWGDDVEQFNPDREFKDDEIWGDDVFRAYNPGGDRFSPLHYNHVIVLKILPIWKCELY